MKEENIKPMPGAQKDLQKTLQEGDQPSVENLMLALNRANNTIQNMRMQINQMAENYRDLQIRLAEHEFQNRLDFLWKVMFTECSDEVFGIDFCRKCTDEFKLMMFPPVEEPGTTEKKEQNV